MTNDIPIPVYRGNHDKGYVAFNREVGDFLEIEE